MIAQGTNAQAAADLHQREETSPIVRGEGESLASFGRTLGCWDEGVERGHTVEG